MKRVPAHIFYGSSDRWTTPIIIVSLIPGLTAVAWSKPALPAIVLGLLALSAVSWIFRDRLAQTAWLNYWTIPILILINLLFFLFWVIGAHFPEAGLLSVDVTIAYTVSSALVITLSYHRNPTDRYILFFMSFLLFLIAAIEKSPWFLPLFLIYVALAFHISMRLRYSRVHEQGTRISPYLYRFMGFILPPTLILATFLFIFIPRPFVILRESSGNARDRLPTTPHGPDRSTETGFEPLDPEVTMTLADLERMLSDPHPIGSVTLTTAGSFRLQSPLYARIETLDRYHQGTWTNTHSFSETRDAADGKEDGRIALAVKRMAKLRFPLITQEFTWIVPFRKIPVLPEPASISIGQIALDRHGSFAVPAEKAPLRNYRLESHGIAPILEDIEETPEFQTQKEYLDVPPELSAIRAMAADAARDRKTMQDQIRSLEKFLSEGYRYRLDVPEPPPGTDPVLYFLAGSREGFCTHYASSMVLMLRSLGIPSRLAVGFLLKEPTEDKRGFIIRRSHGHAWAEIYSGAYGWIPVDPTPPRQDLASSTSLADAGGRPTAPPAPKPDPEDMHRPRWDEDILAYDKKSYSVLIADVGDSIRTFMNTLVLPVLPYLLAAVLFLLLLLLSIFWLLPGKIKTRITMAVAGFHRISTVDFYRRFLWLMARKRMVREPGMTPLEFTASIRNRIPEDHACRITEHFYRVRYGRRELTEEQTRDMENRLSELEAWTGSQK